MFTVDYFKYFGSIIEWSTRRSNNYIIQDSLPFDNGNNTNFETIDNENWSYGLTQRTDNTKPAEYLKTEIYDNDFNLITTIKLELSS